MIGSILISTFRPFSRGNTTAYCVPNCISKRGARNGAYWTSRIAERDHPSAVNCRWFREFDEHSRGAASLSMTDVEHERDDSRLRRHVKLHPDAIIQPDSAFSFSSPHQPSPLYPHCRLLNGNDPSYQYCIITIRARERIIHHLHHLLKNKFNIGVRFGVYLM